MEAKLKRREPQALINREFHNIRELLEMLLSEHTPSKHKIRMKAGLGWTPPTDVFETETELVIIVDIAGMDRQDISVFTDGSLLTIQGVRNEVSSPGKKQFHKMEIQVGPFQRLIPIPVEVEAENFSTNYSNGLLEIRMKKKIGEEVRRKIEVE